MASKYVPLATLLLPFAVFGLAGCGSTTRANPAPAAAPVSAALTVTSISPATVPAGSADLTLTITGTGFTAASLVRLSGTSEPTTYTSATQLRAVIPSAQLAAGAALAVSVVDGNNSSAAAQAPTLLVSNPIPTVSGLSPASIPAGSPGFTLDIAGTGFVPASMVSLAGAPLAATFVSATELRAAVPAGSIVAGAAVPVIISSPTPGGGQSAPAAFAVIAPQPAIRSLMPSAVPMGSAATIAVAGSGFEANSVVLWNGTARPTMFQNAGALTVTLSAADLAVPGTAQIAVSNPGPGAAVSLPATLTVSPHAGPSITSVTVAAMPQTGGCDRIQATITGAGFTQPGGVQVNGTALAPFAVQTVSPTQMVAVLPSTGFSSLSIVVTDNNYPPLASPAYAYPASAPPVFSVCPVPNPATVYPGTGFLATVQATRINVASPAAVMSLGSLPAGITLQTPLPAAIPPAGAVLRFQASSTVAPGSYTVPIHGQAGSAGSDSTFAFTVKTGAPPAPQWIQPFYPETAVAIGSSVQQQFTLFQSFPAADYTVTPSVSGLPPGVTASFDPQVVIPGGTTTLTLQAAANAPVTMNQTVTVTGTADAPVQPATTSFLLEVTDAPGTRPDNATDFTPTGGTPYGAVFDRAHHFVFASNPSWNRIDVLDTETHAIVKQVSVRDPRGIDITPDGSRVWVATGSRRMVSIDPATFAMRTVELPLYGAFPGPITTGNVTTGTWEGDKVFALADGTFLLFFSGTGAQAGNQPVAVWDPAADTLTQAAPPLPVTSPLARNGDGTEVYFETSSSNCAFSIYSTATRKTAQGPVLTTPCTFAAVNRDGSRVIVGNSHRYSLYDGSFRFLGDVPGNPQTLNDDVFLFSPNSATIYRLAVENGPALFHTIDAATLKELGTAPAMVTTPVGVSGSLGISRLFDVDSHGQLLGIQNFGIAFEDPTSFQHYAAQQPTQGTSPVPLTPDSGPLAGGTDSSIYGGFPLTPDVWYGSSRGTAVSGANSGTTAITSPASSTPGPVNVKLLFPDGNQVFMPQSFTYGPYPQYAVLSGSGPDGGVAGKVAGYGLPLDASGGTVTVGGGSAPITTKKAQYPPYTGEPFPSTFLQYTVPAGTPGWADVQVTTPDGTGTLPKGHFYAQSVTDYPSGDSFTAVLYDNKRDQVYLSAGDHIDVFSMRSRQFLAPLHPAAQGRARLFTGLALTTDGSLLLAADLLDGSLGVIDPDAPANSYSIPIAPANINKSCQDGPLYVAPTANNLVFITTGGLCATGPSPQGITYVASLQARSAIRPSAKACGIGTLPYPFTDGLSVDSPADGSYVAIGGTDYSAACIYSTAQNSFAPALGNWQRLLGVSVAGDGHVLASGDTLADPAGNLVGRLARPIVEFGSDVSAFYNPAQAPNNSLLRPRLNASGSLFYWAFPHSFDILDVVQGTLRIRFSLAETIQNTAAPLAVDPGGRQVFLITDKGLTVVDLGTAPLSIGHVGQLTGTQLTVRGSGFSAGTTATVEGEPAAVSFTDDSTLTLSLPALKSGPQDITLTNPDGTGYTLQSAVTVP